VLDPIPKSNPQSDFSGTELVDVVSVSTRSLMMAGIRGKNTKPEIQVRKALHGLGFRFGRSNARLPGKPDIVLPRWKVAVFVNGCFWHWHGCQFSKLPASNKDFWLAKLSANRDRDVRVLTQLTEKGWRVVTIWECALRKKHIDNTFNSEMLGVAQWIREEFIEKSFVVPSSRRANQINDNEDH
jgi:DNA mismatch endonuclease (patch repair protein)